MYNRIVYIVKTDLHYYPPCMMQIRYLKQMGVNIEVWFASSNESATNILEKEDIPYVCLGESTRKNTKISKIKNWLEFRFRVKKQLKTINKNELDNILFWVGTAESAIPLYGVIDKYHYVLTMLELLDDPQNRIKLKLFGRMAKKAEALTACEITRAYLMRYWFKLDKLPYVMPNKPFELGVSKKAIPSCEKTRSSIEIIKDKHFIIFQGIYQKLDYLKEVAKALAKMNIDYHFVLMGFDLYKTNAYEELKRIYDKVIELPSLPAPLHLEVTSHAEIGLVFYDDFSLNQAFCAPNKIYEYSGFGIPMLANKIPGLENTVGKYNAGMCVNFECNELVGAINTILDNHKDFEINSKELFDSVDNMKTISKIAESLHIERE